VEGLSLSGFVANLFFDSQGFGGGFDGFIVMAGPLVEVCQ
jgi:hypothetical protein